MTIDFITQEKDYWVASNAINITLNALSDPNRIQCSVSSGAVVRCFYEHIDEADSLGYTVAHDYHQWPISSSPTYFNSNTEKYVYIAIPRSAAVGVQAIVVFPSDKLDIYGRKAVKSTDPETGEETIVYEQIGSTDYFYVWLQATISAPLLIDGVLQRIWTTQIATGKLDTPQGDAERETDSEWYLWSAIGGFVTFLREIRMSVDSWFANIRLGKDKRELTGVATADTPDEFVDSETLVVTPSYLSNKFLRKDMDDSTPYSLGVGEDLTVGGDVDVTGQERVDVVQSHNYSGSGLADTGFLITNDNGSGDSLGVFDYLTVRKKMIINSLEIKETHFSAGDVAHTLASAEIARTDYFYVDEEGNRELLGYSTILVPWSLKGGLLALAKGNLKGIFGHYKKVRLTLTQSQLERCNRIRCYFLAKDGEREIENWFRANDLVRCQTWNVLKTKRETFIPNLEEHDGNVYWWRKVHDVSWNTGVTRYVAKDAQGNPTGSPTTNPANAYVNEGGVKRLYDNGIYHTKGTEGYDDHQPVTIDGNTYHWFDVAFGYNAERSGEANWCDMGSDLPAAGDKVIQFGNTTDPDRMNIFMIEVNGSGNPDAPDWKMYRGVYTFNLTNCWWGGESCRKTKWSVATGIEAYAPQFNWITEYGIARQVFVRDEVYWNKIPFERDDDWSKAISSYPDYSDDIVDANGRFVSRADGSPKNYVRKCRYYEQVSHNGSAWLCSVVESFYWRSADGRKISAKTDGAEYVRNYTYDEPSAESNNWTEQVEKGDPGAFKSSVFCRTNKDISAYQPQGGTYDNPIPTSTRNAQGVVDSSIVWTDGIPAGDAMLWETTAWFYSNADPAPWTPPRKQTDNETLDIEFSPKASQPSAPYGTAENKDTASTKAQRHSQGWYDPNDTLPSGVTWSDMKWRAERKIKNGEYYGSWAVSRIKGENSVRIDLDNENDSMLYTSGGKLVSGNVLSTARLFDGATDVSTSADWKMTAVGCTMSSGNSRNIVVTGMTASTGYVNVQAVYTDKNGTVYTKTARLTLKKLVDVDKYDLDITPNSIAYNATKDQPETSVLTIKVWKMTVDGNRVLSNPPSGYGVYVNNAKQTASSTGTYSYTTDNSAISSVQVKIAKDADLDAILDSETIPVNKAEDGAPGTSPYFADIDNEMDSVACDKNGKTLTAYDTTIGVSLWHGSHPLDITTLTTDSIQGFTITPNKSARTIRIQVAKDTSIAEVNKIGITIAGSGSGNLPLHFVLNGVRQGENGEPAVLYSLIPSVSSVVRKKDGTYSVDNVSCTRQKNVGGTITNNTTDGAITYKLDGGTEKAYTNNTDIAVTSFTKSIQFIFKVDGKVVDIETIPMVADGVDGVTPTVEIVDGYWVINGQPTGVKAEGTDGTGVEIKGSVAHESDMESTGYVTPVGGTRVMADKGDCYICNSDRHLYMWDGAVWVDLGEFQGEPGKNSYMHIAYAKKNPLNVSTSTVDTIGFTVNSDGSQYEWMGICTDDKESDPGRNWSSLSPSQKVAAVNAYKWNYMKGKDGSGYEYIYLLTKEGFKPTIDESSGQGSQSDDEFYPSVGNYQDGKIYDNSRYWNDDPPADISETWPVLWWSSRKKSDGVWQAFGSVDLHNRYAKNGTSPWIADLDNEMDSVACDNDGKPVVQQAVSTNVSLFYGSQKKAFITSVNGGDTGITISFSNKTSATAKDSDTVTITFATNAVISGKKEFEITLTAKDDASIQRVLTLTVNGLKGGATYNLVPSDSFVLLNKANQYVPNVLTCTYNKFDVAKGQFVTPSGGTVKYIKDGETAENAYKQLVPGTDFTNNVTFLLYVGTTLVDRETIHIVKDGTDGLSAQSYIETQEAWSNQETTASADTMPSDCQEGDWKDSTPANTNSRTYLWRRSRKMTLKTDKSGYDAGQWSYTRLSGTNGTSIKTQGTVANTSKLLDRQVIPLVNGSDGQRTDVQDGWAYISEADRHLYQWSDELRSKSSTWVDWRSGWLDLGEFKGESGKTYYTHIAWAKGIILKKDGDGRAVTTDRTAGQRTMPNAVYPMTAAEQALFDFSIAPQEDLTWMGTLVDEDTTDAADYKYYTWKYVQGADGENSIRLALDNEHEDFLYNASGELVAPAGGATSQARLYDGALPISANSVTWAVDFSKSSGVPTAGQNAPTCVNGLLTVPHVTGASAKVAVKATYDRKDYFAEFTANKTEGDKYDIVVKPNAIPYNSSEVFTEKTINLSVKGIDAQGHNIDSISIDTSATPSAGKFCVFWGYVNANGSVGTLANLKASSKKVTAVECNTYAGIYFELRRYSDSTNYRLCDYETVEIAKVQNGDSNLIVDLDNQADQFGTDSNDVVQGDAVRSTGVSLYYGSDPQEFLAIGGLTAQLYYASDNDELHPITNGNIATVDVSYSGATGTVTVTVKNGATIADSGLFAKIVAKCAKDTTGKVAYFNLGKVKSGEPGKAPDICNLRPTSKSISFNKSELAGSTPKKLGCGYTLIKDSVTTNAETAESVVVNGVTYYIYWRYVGGTYARFTTSSAIWATGILPATSEKGVEFCLSSADTASGINTQNTLDTENVPVVKDGINGSATFHEIQSSQASVIVGAESTQAVINANFIFRLNTSGVYSAYSCYYAVYRRKGGTYTLKKSSSAKATTGSYSETENDYTKVDAFVVVMSDAPDFSATDLPSSFLSKLEIPVEKQGGQGPQGEAAWAFSANPANVIITQSLDNNLTSFSSATVSFAAKKGRESATITSIAIPTGQQALSNEFNAAIGTGDDSKKVIVSSPKTHGTPAEYYTEGSFKVVVNAQAADGSTSSQEVTVLCYANLLGTWEREVVGDAEAVAAAKVEYIYDPNNPNQVVKMENFGNYVRSSTKNSAKLERDTTELVKNIANTAFDDIEGTQVALSAGEYIVQLNVDTEDLPTGNYVFDFAGFHYEGGEQFIEQRITVANSGTYTITLHDDVQSGTGVATMLYIGRVFNVSSEIKQTANNIMLQVNDKVSQSDFIIFSDSIQSSVKNITPTKNLLKGSLSAKGWLSSPSDIADSGVPYTSAELDDDGYIVTNGNHQYLAQKLTLSGGKKYTLSFYSKKTTAITVTVWIVGYPTMKQAFTVAATDASVRKTVSIEIPLGFGGNMGISINATNIKQPQLEEGDTATDFIADSTEISSGITQTADNIQLFVTQGLSNTGIDITNGTIKLQANKVTFCDANGGNTDKILIDPTNGTLHAVDGHFSGEITATSGSITGQMNIASGGSIIVGKEDSYRIKIAQLSNRGYITMLDGEGDNIILINYDTEKNAGQVKVSEADAQHEKYTFINPYSLESVYNYKNASSQWNGDHSHITTQVGRRMAETEYDDLYVSGGLAARRHIKIGLGTTVSGSSEQSVVNLRAYNDNQESAWPVCSLDPNGANWMDKGHVHVMTMAELKILLDNPDYTYSSHLANYAVMLTRINGN